jgi:hypothetical protein
LDDFKSSTVPYYWREETVNPQIEHDRLLRQHKFELVSERNHLKYNDPAGRVYVTAKTPSDWRAYLNQVSVLKRVIAAPVPSNSVLEEMRQRKELEQFITLNAAQKKSAVGIAGAGKKKKSRGTGFIYEDKPEKTAEQIALEEETRERARANNERKDAEKKERRDERRKNEEWSNQLASFRRQARQVNATVQRAWLFAIAVGHYETGRTGVADRLRRERKLGEGVSLAEARRRDDYVGRIAFNQKKETDSMASNLIENSNDAFLESSMTIAYMLTLKAGKFPRWALHSTDEQIEARRTQPGFGADVPKQQIRHYRMAAGYVTDWIGPVLKAELARYDAQRKIEREMQIRGEAA